MEEKEIGVSVGIDWSDRKHDIFEYNGSTGESSSYLVDHTPEALAEWVQSIRARAGGKKIAVCLEQSRGALIYALLKYDCFAIYPVNGSTLASYRQAFRPNRGKDDPTDSEYLLEILRTQRKRLRCFEPEDEQTRRLQYLVEYRRKLVNDCTRISNRLTSYLKGYFPQILEWFPEICTKITCDFLERWATLEELQAEPEEKVIKFFLAHRSRSERLNRKRSEEIRKAIPLVTDRAIIESSVIMVKALASQLRILIENVSQFDRHISSIMKRHADAFIFESLPGGGDVNAPRMLAAFGSRRERYGSAGEASQFFGIAPAREQSGNSCWIRWRYFCPKFLRQTFHEFAGASIQFSFWAKEYYAKARAKGKSHHVAVRSLAFKWIRIIWRCWQDRVPYDEVKYLNKLKAKGSPVLQQLAAGNA